MSKKILFIVESPTKIKTLQKIINSNLKIKNVFFIATLGHIKNLPTKSLGVDLSVFEPKLVVLSGKERILKNLKKSSTKVDEIYLATDPDREGEAISIHVYEFLKPYADRKIFKRIELREITALGLKNALEKARNVDYGLYTSWKARRVLDRLIGYLVSPSLSKVFRLALSAGRVQSPALKLIVEREKEIEEFKKEKFYSLVVSLEDSRGKSYEFGLYYKGKLKKVKDKKELLDFFEKYLKDREILLEDIIKKEITKAPPAPYKTTTLIEDAGQILGLKPKETMKIAQALYEKGLITYMRTDSIRISPLAIEQGRKWIEENFGKEYVGENKKSFSIKRKDLIQDAHECIRPTHLEHPLGLSKLEEKIYKLIFTRFVASLASKALFVDTIYIGKEKNLPKDYSLQLRIRDLLFHGYLRIWKFDDFKKVSEKDETLFFSEEKVHILKKGEILKVKTFKIKEYETKPPTPYTPHSLIKKLESLGIGRPSTYPIIIETLLKRKYVVLEKRSGYLIPTELGKRVCEYLNKKLSLIMDYDFTARTERALDEISNGNVDYIDFLEKHYLILKNGITTGKKENFINE